MTDVTVQTALIGAGSSIGTALIGGLGIFIKKRLDRRATEATAAQAEASAESLTMDTMSRTFRTLTDHMSAQIDDFRHRVAGLEDDVRALRTQLDEERSNAAELRRTIEHLTGEIRQRDQIIAGMRRQAEKGSKE